MYLLKNSNIFYFFCIVSFVSSSKGLFYRIHHASVTHLKTLGPPKSSISLLECHKLCFDQSKCKSFGYLSDNTGIKYAFGKCYLLSDIPEKKNNEESGDEVPLFLPFRKSTQNIDCNIEDSQGVTTTTSTSKDTTLTTSVITTSTSAAVPRSCSEVFGTTSESPVRIKIRPKLGKDRIVNCYDLNAGVSTQVAKVIPDNGVVSVNDIFNGFGSSAPSKHYWFPLNVWFLILNYNNSNTTDDGRWILSAKFLQFDDSTYPKYQTFQKLSISNSTMNMSAVYEGKRVVLSFQTCPENTIWLLCESGEKTGFENGKLYHRGNELSRIEIFIREKVK